MINISESTEYQEVLSKLEDIQETSPSEDNLHIVGGLNYAGVREYHRFELIGGSWVKNSNEFESTVVDFHKKIKTPALRKKTNKSKTRK